MTTFCLSHNLCIKIKVVFKCWLHRKPSSYLKVHCQVLELGMVDFWLPLLLWSREMVGRRQWNNLDVWVRNTLGNFYLTYISYLGWVVLLKDSSPILSLPSLCNIHDDIKLVHIRIWTRLDSHLDLGLLSLSFLCLSQRCFAILLPSTVSSTSPPLLVLDIILLPPLPPSFHLSLPSFPSHSQSK